ncbi:alpha-tocopherol transfer protein-like isoform X3 [Centruroides sculpturatus]|uniref:alpha-tocopherol transfer protein-like isoform X3 n=1 Tax=Centruroides sculpturatus TaxID=218467 RepID=UPI000C6C9AD1|nr:alpha-tocopherol transfer protein-like isoform X3 [Centruroides sculpturatus]
MLVFTIIEMAHKIFIDSSKEEKLYTWNEKELRSFKDIIIKEKINCRMDDLFLLSFLRARKFDRERALKLLKSYYSARKRNWDMFNDFNPLAMKEYLDMKMVGYLQQTDQEGRVLGIGRSCAYPKKTFYDKCLLSKNIGSTPIRYKEIHVVNIGKFAHAFIAAFLPFLPYKIKKRMHFHSSGMESLHKFIDPKYLPVEYGGELPPFDPTECNEKLLEYQDFFEEQEKYLAGWPSG